MLNEIDLADQGATIYSPLRKSTLEPHESLDHYFDTKLEHQSP